MVDSGDTVKVGKEGENIQVLAVSVRSVSSEVLINGSHDGGLALCHSGAGVCVGIVAVPQQNKVPDGDYNSNGVCYGRRRQVEG